MPCIVTMLVGWFLSIEKTSTEWTDMLTIIGDGEMKTMIFLQGNLIGTSWCSCHWNETISLLIHSFAQIHVCWTSYTLDNLQKHLDKVHKGRNMWSGWLENRTNCCSCQNVFALIWGIFNILIEWKGAQIHIRRHLLDNLDDKPADETGWDWKSPGEK